MDVIDPPDRTVLLPRLRRLYHHVVNGGTTNVHDLGLVGREPTAANISALIQQIEVQQSYDFGHGP